MTNGASRSITAKAAANIRSAERASIDNDNVEKGLGSKGLELPNGGKLPVFVGFNLFAGSRLRGRSAISGHWPALFDHLIGLPGHRLRPHGLTQSSPRRAILL